MEDRKITYLGKTISYSNECHSIIVQTNGQYKGCDGNMYPYTSTVLEGNSAKDVWEILKYLDNEIKG